MTKEVKIYTLVDPDIPEKIRYIGKTNRTLNKRLIEHICHSNIKVNPVSCWIKKLIKNGKKPVIELLDTCSENEWEKYEKFYISYGRSLGIRLLNYEDGGVGGKIFKKYIKKNVDSRKKVVQQIDLETNIVVNEFESASDAAKAVGIRKEIIVNTCRGMQKKTHGYKWKYKNEEWSYKGRNFRVNNKIKNYYAS